MPIKVEAAVVTQKKQNTPFNTDSVNINGKVLPHEVIQNGYKGTGVMDGTVFFSISSSDIEGFADASVAAFNERAENFKEPNANPSDIITGYFKDSVYALGEMGHRSSELASSIMYASGNNVILAKTGNTQLYAYSKNGFAKVTPALFANEDGASQYGLCTFPTVAAEDIFLLVSPGVSQVLTDKDLDDICKVAEGSVKKIVTLIARVTATKEGSGGISAIAVKVTETAEEEAPVFGFAGVEKRAEPSGSPVGAFRPDDGRLYSSEAASSGKTKKLTAAVLVAVVIIVLLACAALAMKIFGKTIGGLFNKEKETTTAVVTTTELPSETTTKAPVTTTVPVTTTMPVTTTVPVTTTAKAASASTARPSGTNRSDDEDEDEDEEEEEENTTDESEAATSETTTAPQIPEELSRFETEASSETTPVVPSETGTGFFD